MSVKWITKILYHSQFRIGIEILDLSHAVDEEVVLVHVHLNARSSAIEVEKGLSTML